MGGASFPIVGIWQLDLDPRHGSLVAGTHGRGAFGMVDATPRPALVLSKVDAGVPVGPKSVVTYTLTVKNIGTGPATSVVVTDPLPANTTFQGAMESGAIDNGVVKWTIPAIAAGASAQVHFQVSISDALKKKVSAIVNDGVKAVSAEGPFTTGSPFITDIADPYEVAVTPATQVDGGRVNTTVTYHVAVKNLGYIVDSYALSASGGSFPLRSSSRTARQPQRRPIRSTRARALMCASRSRSQRARPTGRQATPRSRQPLSETRRRRARRR